MPAEQSWLQPYSDRVRVMAGVLVLFSAMVLGVAGLAFLASFAWPSGVAPDTRFFAGRVNEFTVDQPVYFEQHKLFVVRRPDDTFLALYAINPHNLPGECPVEWITGVSAYGWAQGRDLAGVFRAPCHGETFDITGERIFGPSPRGLDRFPVVIDGDNVIVKAGVHELIKGPAGR